MDATIEKFFKIWIDILGQNYVYYVVLPSSQAMYGHIISEVLIASIKHQIVRKANPFHDVSGIYGWPFLNPCQARVRVFGCSDKLF